MISLFRKTLLFYGSKKFGSLALALIQPMLGAQVKNARFKGVTVLCGAWRREA
jgi:hypothetical protein